MAVKKADGIVKKYALIINGDTEERHLGNVDRAVAALRAEDSSFRVSVVSPVAPKNQVDHYVTPRDANIKRAVADLKSKMDADDVFVVYLTGHGGEGEKNQGCVDMPDSCYELPQLQKDLANLKWGKRTVVMDQCNGGSGAKLFFEPKTTVISEGGVGEEVSCGLFAPYFWSDKVTDSNRDGVISVQERFAYALRQGQTETNAQFLTESGSASLTGVPSKKTTFPLQVFEASTESELRQQLAQLKPGQLALVDFSAHWCGPCKAYYPEFQQLAKAYGGSFLLIHAQAKKEDQVGEDHWNSFNVGHYPTVAFIDAKGQIFQVDQRMIGDPARELENLVGKLENFQIESAPPELPDNSVLRAMVFAGIVPADTIQLLIDAINGDNVLDVAEALEKILLIPQRLILSDQRHKLMEALQESYDAFPEALGIQAIILEVLVNYQARTDEFSAEFPKKVEDSIAQMRLAYEQGRLPGGQYWLQFAGRALLFLAQTRGSENESLQQELAKDMRVLDEARALLDQRRHNISNEAYTHVNGALLKLVFDLTKNPTTKDEAFQKLHWLQEQNVADVMDVPELQSELMAIVHGSRDEAAKSHVERLALVHEVAQSGNLLTIRFETAFAVLYEQLVYGDAEQRLKAYQQLSVLQCTSATNYSDDVAIEHTLFEALKFERDAQVRAKMVHVAQLFEHDIPREKKNYLDRTISVNSLEARALATEPGFGYWHYPLGRMSYGLRVGVLREYDLAGLAGARVSLFPNQMNANDHFNLALAAWAGVSWAESVEPVAELELHTLLPVYWADRVGVRPIAGFKFAQFTPDGVHGLFGVHVGLEILFGEK